MPLLTGEFKGINVDVNALSYGVIVDCSGGANFLEKSGCLIFYP